MKKTSIIISAWNMLEYTQQCLESIKRFTDQPYELVLIDNGFEDGTWKYFKAIKDARIIRNDANNGFAGAYNQGMQAAARDYYLILNNNTVVTPNWLSNMQRCLESNPLAGMVEPRTNYIAGPQMLEEVKYENIEEMWRFAAKFNRPDPAKWWEANCLYGLCWLLKKEVVEKVGYMDEELEFFADYCRRIRNAGYQLMCAGDTFIHHYGSRTYLGNKVNISQLMDENREEYLKKMGVIRNKGRLPISTVTSLFSIKLIYYIFLLPF